MATVGRRSATRATISLHSAVALPKKSWPIGRTFSRSSISAASCRQMSTYRSPVEVIIHPSTAVFIGVARRETHQLTQWSRRVPGRGLGL
jgi:hypothetical protein